MPPTETLHPSMHPEWAGLSPINRAYRALAQHPGAMITDVKLARIALGPHFHPDLGKQWFWTSLAPLTRRAAQTGLQLYTVSGPSPYIPDDTYLTLQPRAPIATRIYDLALAQNFRATTPPAYHEPLLDILSARITAPDQAIFKYAQHQRRPLIDLAYRFGQAVPMLDVLGVSPAYATVKIKSINAHLLATGNPLRIFLIDGHSQLILLLYPQNKQIDIPYPLPGLEKLPPPVQDKIRASVRLKNSGLLLQSTLTATQLRILTAMIRDPDTYGRPDGLGISPDNYKQQIFLMGKILGQSFFQKAARGFNSHHVSHPDRPDGKYLDSELSLLLNIVPSELGAVPLEILRILHRHRGRPVPDNRLLLLLKEHIAKDKDLAANSLRQHISSLRPYLLSPWAITRDLFLRGYLFYDTRTPPAAADLLAARLPDYRKLPPPLVDFLLWAHAPTEFSNHGIINRFHTGQLAIIDTFIMHPGQILTPEQIYTCMRPIKATATREQIRQRIKPIIFEINSHIRASPFNRYLTIRNEYDTGYYLESL